MTLRYTFDHLFFSTNSAVVEPLPTGQEAHDYLARTVNPTLQKGLANLCKMKPAEPIVSNSLHNVYLFYLRYFYWEFKNWLRLEADVG